MIDNFLSKKEVSRIRKFSKIKIEKFLSKKRDGIKSYSHILALLLIKEEEYFPDSESIILNKLNFIAKEKKKKSLISDKILNSRKAKIYASIMKRFIPDYLHQFVYMDKIAYIHFTKDLFYINKRNYNFPTKWKRYQR